MTHPEASRTEAGFALIEILVAFVIGVMALAAFFPLFSGNLEGIARAGRKEQALLLAQSQLDAVGADLPSAPGRAAGRAEGGFGWQVDVLPYAGPAPAQTGSSFPVLQITATVTWREGPMRRSVSLHSLRPSRLQPVP